MKGVLYIAYLIVDSYEGIKRANPTYWVEGQQGIYIPLIDKVLLKDNVSAQYQHLLRLCGLDELAVNFKI